MKLILLQRMLFVFIIYVFLFTTNIIAQPPCSSQPPIYSVDTSNRSTTVICNNNPLTLSTISLGTCPDCTYEWSDGTTGPFLFVFTPGNYNVTVTDNAPGGCVGVSSTLTITQSTLSQPIILGDSFNICNNNPLSLDISNPCPICTYEWFKGGASDQGPNIAGINYSATTAGSYYVQVVDTLGCRVNSEILSVGSVTASVPPLMTTSYSICDSNTITLSTIDCNGCDYEWQFYDYNPEEKLVITGVFNGTRPGGTPKGIELYAIGNITDLSQYSISIASDGAASAGGHTPDFTFPTSVAIPAGTFIYVAEDAASFSEFFGFGPNYTSAAMNIDGNDAVELYLDTLLVDLFGNRALVSGPTDYPDPLIVSGGWAYDTGWAYRKPNREPNMTFTSTDWTYGNDNFHLDRDNGFWAIDSFPDSTFTVPATPDRRLVIAGVFSDTIGGVRTRGVELYALGNIGNLSNYSIGVALDGGGLSGSTYTFPATSVTAGTYIYVTDNQTNFTNFFGATSNVNQTNVVSAVDGNDAIALFRNTNLIDVFGDTVYTGTPSWNYELGWATSDDNRIGSPVFDENNWTIMPNAWINCPTNNTCSSLSNAYPIGTVTFETYYSSLVISGVFDGNRPNGGPKGIEFYAVDAISNLSNYSVSLTTAGGTSTALHTFPAVSLGQGDYYYLTDDATKFNAMFGVVSNMEVATGLSVLDGNDAIDLHLGGNLVDKFGENLALAADFSAAWVYEDGWAYRNSGNIANNGMFFNVNWTYNNHGYRPTNAIFPIAERMPIQSYSNSSAGTVLKVIPGQDSSIYETKIVGDYIVKVEYPNGCTMLSDTVSIDTLIFEPRIVATMLSSGDTSTSLSYLCYNSTVDLSMMGTYSLPPIWSYQWSRNGVPLSNETGFNYTATSPGIYIVKVVDDNGCVGYSNAITIVNSTNGSNPSVSASTLYLCSASSTALITTPPCTGCSYIWETETGAPLNNASTTKNTHLVTGEGGYLVNVTDLASGCTYNSPIVLIKDTIYQAPTLTASSSTVCSATPIDLSTTPCAGCNYIWKKDSSGTFVTHDSTQQYIYQIDSGGQYRVEILYPNGCRTNFSNTIEATFQTINANIIAPQRSICDPQQPVTVTASPAASACAGCQYQFLRDSVRMQMTAPYDEQDISLAGNYQVIITNTDGCADTSDIPVEFTEVNISTSIRQSAKKICSQTSSIVLEVDSCDGCNYQWRIGNTTLNSSTDTFYIATGYAAAETYVVVVSKLGCTATDTVVLDSVPERSIFIEIDSTVSAFPTICNGSAVVLLDSCQACIDSNYYQYQWFFNGDTIVGASFESYQVDTPGNYYVQIVDIYDCEATSNTITVQEFSPPTNFALDFSALGPAVPITYGTFSLDDHLFPASLRSQGSYSSLTANGAIFGDSINVGGAGSGFHFITYSYTDGNGNCTFSTYDTLEVLGAVAMDILNTKQSYLNIPASEACLFDTLVITLTNFTFIPNEVLFVAGGGNSISVPVSPSLSVFAGVYSGSFTVIVPQGARTGKLTLSDGTSSYESPNFFVIQNPAVTIDLVSTIQPICSNLDTAVFKGEPVGGSFSAHYLGMANNPSLLSDSLLLLDSIENYSSGVQSVMMVYTYTPTYTATTIACRDSVVDSLLVEIRDVKLDSVLYTPISTAQASEPLVNLTHLTYPISARYYTNSYNGTYVLANALLPSTVPSAVDTITYQINNGGCLNASNDPIDIWPRPGLLDSIPTYLCSQDDTVFIQRNVDSLKVVYRGEIIFRDALYTYTENLNQFVGNPFSPDVRYSERINLMEISSSSGGIDTISLGASRDTFLFVPSNVVGGIATLTLKFLYSRTSNYYSGGTLLSIENTDYTIAEVSKQFIIENPSIVSINPVILADTIFCPINANQQFLGFPAGGQYYISGANIGYDSLVNNIFNPTDYPSGNSYGLTYVYTGQACVDSAYTGIYLPDPFSIEVQPNNGTGEYCKTAPNDTILFSLVPPIAPTVIIDTASAQFFIGGVQTGTIFSPVQVGPPGDYNVRYVVADIYGCTQEALDTFVVHPIPNLGISSISSVFCLNDDTTQLHLSQIEANGNNNTLTTWLGSGGIGYVQGETVEFTGNGIVNGGNNPTMPYFYPRNAGVGVHAIRYVYADSNACMDSINFNIEILPLPQVYMTTTGGTALDSFYCENDSIPLYGFPIGTSLTSGYGSDTSILNGIPTSLDSADQAFEPYINGTQPGILQEVLFYYYEDNNACRDTARYPVKIRNFTTDPSIAGLPTAVCASDVDIPVWAATNGGYDLDSLGWFTSDFATGFSQLTDTINTDSILFYPDSANIHYANRDVVLTFHYTDTSRSCFNEVKDTVLVRALPHLTLSEELVTPLQPTMDLLGSKLNSPSTDTFYHMCETAPRVPIYAYNTTGSYNIFTGLTLNIPTHITPDTGSYILGRGVQSNMDPVNTAYGYIPGMAGYGLDTIRYVYTDSSGCTDSIEHYIFVDSLPSLSFAGLSNYQASINRYVYCQVEPDTPSILPTPTGVDWTMTFNGQNIGVVPFQLLLDTLAVAGTYVDYPLKYNYVGQIYVSGEVCADSLMDTIQVRPSPALAWVNVPTEYCMLDSLERLPLSATPYGGQFIDATNNFQVIAGIVADSLFNPSAQAGKRDIYYYYKDPVSGCEDTIQHSIYVYNKPRINFNIEGGCTGSLVEFRPQTAPYGLLNNTVAIDSITRVIWDFGDNTSRTWTTNLPGNLVIPSDTHTYNNPGIYYASLTVENQGVCDTTFVRRIIISPKATPLATAPYVEDFEAPGHGWMQEGADSSSVNGIITDSLWQWGAAIGTNINSLGNLVWGTRLVHQPTTYRSGENAWVYSPCFDLSDLDRPMIQLSLWRNAQKPADGAVLQYYDDVTNSWEVLGKRGKGINWYQDGYVVSGPGNQTGTPIGWTGTSSGWEDARYRLDNVENDLRNRTSVRFRVAFASAPNTVGGVRDGVAFDNVKVGNRTRNVLLEHFSGTGYPGIEGIEDQLYPTIFNNLYGRDMHLIQYHINKYNVNGELLHNFNPVDNRERAYIYKVTEVDRARINGKELVSKTSDLLNYPYLEQLDIEALTDPKFKLEFLGFPQIGYSSNNKLTVTIRITALEDLPFKRYALHAVVTEDSLGTTTNHSTLGVMRYMYPDNLGMQFVRDWTAGSFYDTTIVVDNFDASKHVLSNLEVVTFVQDIDNDPAEVFQVMSTRNLTQFNGPVDTLDVSVDKIEDHPGYEVATLKLYPNPTKDLFSVEFDKELEADYEWQLVDVVGRIHGEGKVEQGTQLMQVATDKLSAGMYIFIVKNKTVYTQRKVIVQRH